ncbi:hypothetical protein GCM10011394_00020 [Luteimonas terricola]|uniref:Uncharacterized protein n=1 Tax=Luteimonas terricola TaxID=645597 RepID=A0ABQ2E7W5_9GAMM|nr:hypothetical protein GCM10011394_00020 [Luteimonas terricola]
MGWPYYAVLSGASDPPKTYKRPAGHGPLPLATVSIGSDDEASFLLYLPERTPISDELRYRVQFEDLAGQVHYSAPFSLCITGSMLGVRPCFPHCRISIIGSVRFTAHLSLWAPRTRGEWCRQNRLRHLGFGHARLFRKIRPAESVSVRFW